MFFRRFAFVALALGLAACSDTMGPQHEEKPQMQEYYPAEEPIVGYSDGTNEYAAFLATYQEAETAFALLPAQLPVEGTDEYSFVVNYKPLCLAILARYLAKAQLTAFLLASAWESRYINKNAAYEFALGAGLMAWEAYGDYKEYQQCRGG
jgi:hypothetical protein